MTACTDFCAGSFAINWACTNGYRRFVRWLRGSNAVHAYEEKHSRARVIWNFGPRLLGPYRAARAAYRQFDAMHGQRGYYLVGSPHHVVRPLGVDAELNSVLAMEFYPGEQFSQAINDRFAELRWPLVLAPESLAYFLAT